MRGILDKIIAWSLLLSNVWIGTQTVFREVFKILLRIYLSFYTLHTGVKCLLQCYTHTHTHFCITLRRSTISQIDFTLIYNSVSDPDYWSHPWILHIIKHQILCLSEDLWLSCSSVQCYRKKNYHNKCKAGLRYNYETEISFVWGRKG